jgi:hypothetical protein
VNKIGSAAGIFLGIFFASAGRPAFAASVTFDIPITIQAPPQIVFTPPKPIVKCDVPPATVVSAMSLTGGDGNPATYTAVGGDTTDFAVAGSNVVIGASGIAAANCPQPGQPDNIEIITIQASQP